MTLIVVCRTAGRLALPGSPQREERTTFRKGGRNLQRVSQARKDFCNEESLRHNFDFFNVSKRLENIPPLGWDRGRSSIHILRSLFGIDWEDMVQVIYAGDSAADEYAMEALKGVAYTFKVINEDATGLTKTWANSRLQGPDAVLTMLKFLQRKLAGKINKELQTRELEKIFV